MTIIISTEAAWFLAGVAVGAFGFWATMYVKWRRSLRQRNSGLRDMVMQMLQPNADNDKPTPGCECARCQFLRQMQEKKTDTN